MSNAYYRIWIDPDWRNDRCCSCCAPRQPWFDTILSTPPAALLESGVDIGEYRKAMEELSALLDRYRHPSGSLAVCCFCAQVLSCNVVKVMPCIQAIERSLYAIVDDEVKEWQHDFNCNVLVPNGVYVRTQSKWWHRKQGGAKPDEFVARWVEFALTPDAVDELKARPNGTLLTVGGGSGDICKTSVPAACCGINYNQLAFYPNNPNGLGPLCMSITRDFEALERGGFANPPKEDWTVLWNSKSC